MLTNMYKALIVHELREGDADKRLKFYEDILDRYIRSNYLNKIIFTNDATSCLKGLINKSSSHHWEQDNPHWRLKEILDPYFIDQNLNAYL